MKTYTQGMAGGLLVAGLLVGGCMVVEEPLAIDNLPRARVTAPAEPVLVADPTDPTLARRFAEPDQNPGGAVDSALLWSQKYQELSETTERLRQENTRLAEENRTLQQKLATAQLELERTQGELADANRFLQDMHGELTRWKSDVLGFREEMRTAQVSQVQALSKILQILGAEPMAGATTSVANASGADKATVSP